MMRIHPGIIALVCLLPTACSHFEYYRPQPPVLRLSDYPCDQRPEVTPPVIANVLTGDHHFENEVHDCQRLVVDDATSPSGLRFGPLVGIFPLRSAITAPDATFREPTVIATVYNWGGYDGDEDYQPLNIRAHWSCLWLQNSPNGWRAAIVGVDSASGGCARPQNRVLVTWNLVVVPQKHATPVEEYPASARWSYSLGQDAAHYIEVRCGTQWCSIGRPGFTPRAHGRLADMPEDSIPGWFDEQHLAVADAGDRLRPGPWGRIAPSAEYVRARREGSGAVRAAFRDGLVAATIGVGRTGAGGGGAAVSADAEVGAADVATYVRKFRLRQNQAVADGGIGIRMWRRFPWLWVTRKAWFTGDTEAPATLHYMDKQEHAAMGATRWRWHEEDEKAWVSCPDNSCCSVES